MSRMSNHVLPDNDVSDLLAPGYLLDSDLELEEPDPDLLTPGPEEARRTLPRSGLRVPPNLIVVNPRARLRHPDRDRRYEFAAFGVDEVRVRKWEAAELTEERETTRESAVKLYRWLKKIGYRPE